MKNRPFLELSKRIEDLSTALSLKIKQKHDILRENSKLKKEIKSEILSHQKSIDNIAEEMQKLDINFIINQFKERCKNPKENKENDLESQNQILVNKIADLKGDIEKKREVLKKFQVKNKENEGKISILAKEFNVVHREFTESSIKTENTENSFCETTFNMEEIDLLQEKIRKITDTIDFSLKKGVFLKNRLQKIEKSHLSLSFLEIERKSLEISNLSLREKLNSSISSSNENVKKTRVRDTVNVFSKKNPQIKKFEGYFKKLKNLHC